MQASTLDLESVLTENRNLERILDNLPLGIIAHDTRRRIVFFNRLAEQITGYGRCEVEGKDCHDAFGRPFCGSRCAFCGQAPTDLDYCEYPTTITNKAGEVRRIEMFITGMSDSSGTFVGVLASFRDVTDLTGLKIQTGELKGFAGIVGQDPSMRKIYEQILEMAGNDYPVHISGETGTGKELVANAIHNESRRGGGPFVPVNCAAIPEGTLESELFGHVRGAFTGALRAKKGRFELAHGGTLFLDEVSDLSLPVQAKLLRVLQEGRFERVGAETATSVDVRIISATNRDLREEVEAGKFRPDLFYRVNVVPIYVPPLRQRKADISLLIEHFFDQAREEGQRVGAGLSDGAMAVMRNYPWPGNVRELQSAVRFALVRSKGEIIRPDHLPQELVKWQQLGLAGHGKAPANGKVDGRRSSKRGPTKKLNEAAVRAAMAQAGGNKAKAARILGVGRATLYRFLSDRSNR
jgi:PAS domain S-box-containing protein